MLPAGGGVNEILIQSVVSSPQTDLIKNSYSWPWVSSVNSIEVSETSVPESGLSFPASCNAYSKYVTSAATHEIVAVVPVKKSRDKVGLEQLCVIPSKIIFGKKSLNWPVVGALGSGSIESE